MNTICGLLFATIILVAGFTSSGPEAGSPGAYGGACLSDGTCDEGLECVDHVCKEKAD